MKKILFILFGTITLSCKTSTNTTKRESKIEFGNWYKEDFTSCGIPGISLFKATSKLKSNKNTIVVAVLDTQIDTAHEDLKKSLWTNKNEVAENGIDDDQNGYIDDVYGWNFLGTKSGNYIVWGNFEYTRIVREYEPVFGNKKQEEILSKDKDRYEQYVRAVDYQNKWSKFYKSYLKSMKYNISLFKKTKDTLRYFFPREDYTLSQLDSLYKKSKVNDKSYYERRDSNDQDLGAMINSFIANLEINVRSYDDLIEHNAQKDSIFNKNCNPDYNERLFVDDNSDILTSGYGTNKINAKIHGIRVFNDHSTKVSSIIAAEIKNDKGIEGFSDSIKIMPLSISPSGDEHDKDIALAIRYAVDNGAKVINMSFAKEFTMYPDFTKEAFKYAEKHDVLLVHAAGNNGFDADNKQVYPSDYFYDNQPEVSANFINVGSINKNYGEKMVSRFSNYGKKNVDLFAPGEGIYTAIPDNKYGFDSGTSLAAPMVSGTAALLWLHYPKLTVQQVKQIILESGTSHDIEVIVPGTKDKKVKFSELSKTGKVLNVFNAMQMAEKISKTKS
ncbi:S8 family serine peptidase [Flavobacterium sp. GCM10023249]|uniref:S8 family serine peptidase n=1 Tax=unclassified Flavobacterium TaxID=196869 RepID=UPI003617100D